MIYGAHQNKAYHYSDVIMSVVASQITGVLIFHSNVCSGAHQREHQSSATLAFARGKGFPLDDVIMASGSGFVDCGSLEHSRLTY